MDYTNNNNNKLLIFIIIFVILFFCSIINKSYDYNQKSTIFNSISDNIDNHNNCNTTELIYKRHPDIKEIYMEYQITSTINNLDYSKDCNKFKESLGKIFIDAHSITAETSEQSISQSIRQSIRQSIIKTNINKKGLQYKIATDPNKMKQFIKYYCIIRIE